VNFMSEVSWVLHRIARGTGIIFAGSVISMFFGFLSRAVIARYFTTSEYGVYNLALTVLSIALVIATLGFRNSLPRQVAFYQEMEPSKVRDLISTALIIAALNSLVWLLVLILGAKFISQVFNEMRLTHVLKLIAPALPFSALIGVIISVSRGFGRVREQVYFQNIFYPTLFLAFVVVGGLFKFSFSFVFLAYVVARAFTLLALTFDIWRSKLFEFRVSVNFKLGKELIKFSIPLMLTGITGFVMTWTDTLMLGYYWGSETVGLYNGAAPIARLLPLFLNSAGLVFPPLATVLYARGNIKELGRVYQILTKWIFLATFPLFSLVLLFPEATISFFFGVKYISAALALQILAFGFMFHTFFGLNWLSLVIIGENNFIMITNFISAAFNIILNTFLIPLYGLEGAATATAISYIIVNAMNSAKLYQRTKIHPFSWNYVKPLVISFVLLGLIKSLNLVVSDIWYAVPILAVFLGVYFFLVLFSKSVDEEDIELLLAIERKFGIRLKIVEKVLKRFV